MAKPACRRGTIPYHTPTVIKSQVESGFTTSPAGIAIVARRADRALMATALRALRRSGLLSPLLARGLAFQPRLTTHYKKHDRSRDSRWEGIDMDRAADRTDVLIVGGGPAGLSAAIKLKQLAAAAGKEYRVTVLEKAGTPGAHTLSGAVLEPRALDELLPGWKEMGAPITNAVTSDTMAILTETMKVPLPIPPRSAMDNHGNYIVRLGNVVAWLAEKVRARVCRRRHPEPVRTRASPSQALMALGTARRHSWLSSSRLLAAYSRAWPAARTCPGGGAWGRDLRRLRSCRAPVRRGRRRRRRCDK
jgi:electron-transferring-flavoprotein dehydrogenase